MIIALIEFWGAMAKIRVRMKVDRHGIPLRERYAIIGACAFEELLLCGIEQYGSENACTSVSTFRYILCGVIVVFIVLRAFYFVRAIYKDIVEMKGSGKTSVRESLARQLKIKFGVFCLVALAFAVYCFYGAAEKIAGYQEDCKLLMSNWYYQYDVSVYEILFLLAGYVILIQFTDITVIFCKKKQKKPTKHQLDDSNDNANLIYAKTTMPVANSLTMHKSQSESVVVFDENQNVSKQTE